MDDLISRQAAIKAVNEAIADYIPTLYGRYEALPLEMAMAIKRLPTADPVRHGKWITESGLAVCSICGRTTSETYIDGSEEWNYCPFCGAKMDGGEE